MNIAVLVTLCVFVLRMLLATDIAELHLKIEPKLIELNDAIDHIYQNAPVSVEEMQSFKELTQLCVDSMMPIMDVDTRELMSELIKINEDEFDAHRNEIDAEYQSMLSKFSDFDDVPSMLIIKHGIFMIWLTNAVSIQTQSSVDVISELYYGHNQLSAVNMYMLEFKLSVLWKQWLEPEIIQNPIAAHLSLQNLFANFLSTFAIFNTDAQHLVTDGFFDVSHLQRDLMAIDSVMAGTTTRFIPSNYEIICILKCQTLPFDAKQKYFYFWWNVPITDRTESYGHEPDVTPHAVFNEFVSDMFVKRQETDAVFECIKLMDPSAKFVFEIETAMLLADLAIRFQSNDLLNAINQLVISDISTTEIFNLCLQFIANRDNPDRLREYMVAFHFLLKNAPMDSFKPCLEYNTNHYLLQSYQISFEARRRYFDEWLRLHASKSILEFKNPELNGVVKHRHFKMNVEIVNMFVSELVVQMTQISHDCLHYFTVIGELGTARDAFYDENTIQLFVEWAVQYNCADLIREIARQISGLPVSAINQDALTNYQFGELLAKSDRLKVSTKRLIFNYWLQLHEQQEILPTSRDGYSNSMTFNAYLDKFAYEQTSRATLDIIENAIKLSSKLCYWRFNDAFVNEQSFEIIMRRIDMYDSTQECIKSIDRKRCNELKRVYDTNLDNTKESMMDMIAGALQSSDVVVFLELLEESKFGERLLTYFYTAYGGDSRQYALLNSLETTPNEDRLMTQWRAIFYMVDKQEKLFVLIDLLLPSKLFRRRWYRRKWTGGFLCSIFDAFDCMDEEYNRVLVPLWDTIILPLVGYGDMDRSSRLSKFKTFHAFFEMHLNVGMHGECFINLHFCKTLMLVLQNYPSFKVSVEYFQMVMQSTILDQDPERKWKIEIFNKWFDSEDMSFLTEEEVPDANVIIVNAFLRSMTSSTSYTVRMKSHDYLVAATRKPGNRYGLYTNSETMEILPVGMSPSFPSSPLDSASSSFPYQSYPSSPIEWLPVARPLINLI